MSASILFAFVIAYFAILLAVAWATSRNSDNNSFFIGNKNSNWMLVAFGMIGTSLSGVTFISVPGAVGHNSFTYFQIILGQLFGYWIIALVLLPLYYRVNLTSIYHYLKVRLGLHSYKTGATFFIISRTFGATARLYLVVNILQATILDKLGVPFWLTTTIILIMILLYTFEGGVKTIVWTDTLQTLCMLGGLVTCIFLLLGQLNMSVVDSFTAMQSQGLATFFETDIDKKNFFIKQILAGVFIAIAMTGMDQEMMQKNISVKKLGDAQKNIVAVSIIMLLVVILFLFLGALLHIYAPLVQETAKGDQLFPAIVMNYLPAWVQVVFIIALISALFPSADGAITALTSSYCIDILSMQTRQDLNEQEKKRLRQKVHLSFAGLFLFIILVFKWVNNPSMIDVILKLASYTYGPLLGLFAFGIISKRKVKDTWVPLIAILAPVLCFLIDHYQNQIFGSYQIGLELLLLNGVLTYIGLYFISYQDQLEQNHINN